MGAMYSLPVSGLGTEELEEEKERLTLQAKAAFGAPPPAYLAWSEGDGMLHVPRFYGLERYGPAERDERVEGEEIRISFVGKLTPIQERATSSVFEKQLSDEGGGGVLVSLPCGYGKTVWAVSAIAKLGRKACVLVHKAVIRDQWKEAFERFCPGTKVGFVQGKTWQVEGMDVVIGMVMTLAKRTDQYGEDTMDAFGTVVVDEAHHMAAPVMSQAMRLFRARNVIALTATKDRPDGLTPLLHWSLGPEGFRVERDSEGVKVSIALFRGATREITNKAGQPLVALMINNLASHSARNRFLASRIVFLRKRGRVIMVLSDRTKQLDLLRDLVVSMGIGEEEVGVFKGGMKDADRVSALERPVVMCTYGMANEGVDKKEADTCVLATPKARVVQCIGRVQRPCETKQYPLVLDVADDTSVFVPLRWARQRLYSKEKYEVQVLDSEVAKEEEWYV